MRVKQLLVFVVLLLGTIACSSVTKDIVVQSQQDASVQFDQLKTYSWLGAGGVLYDPYARYAPPEMDIAAELKFLIDRELRERGYTEVKEDPDVQVGFAVMVDMESLSVLKDEDKNMSIIANIPTGAIWVALLDPASGEALWIGEADADVQENLDEAQMKKRLDYAVTHIIKALP